MIALLISAPFVDCNEIYTRCILADQVEAFFHIVCIDHSDQRAINLWRRQHEADRQSSKAALVNLWKLTEH